jgi:hypothetical protein
VTLSITAELISEIETSVCGKSDVTTFVEGVSVDLLIY